MGHIRRSHPTVKFIVHRDSDFLTQPEIDSYQAKLAAYDAKVFIPAGNDIERYFTDADHIAETCGVSPRDAADVLDEAFQARRADLTKKYVSTRVQNSYNAGVKPDTGEIAAQCVRDMTGPTTTLVHGKTLLKGVRDALRRRGVADRLISLSARLAIPELRAMAPD